MSDHLTNGRYKVFTQKCPTRVSITRTCPLGNPMWFEIVVGNSVGYITTDAELNQPRRPGLLSQPGVPSGALGVMSSGWNAISSWGAFGKDAVPQTPNCGPSRYLSCRIQPKPITAAPVCVIANLKGSASLDALCRFFNDDAAARRVFSKKDASCLPAMIKSGASPAFILVVTNLLLRLTFTIFNSDRPVRSLSFLERLAVYEVYSI